MTKATLGMSLPCNYSPGLGSASYHRRPFRFTPGLPSCRPSLLEGCTMPPDPPLSLRAFALGAAVKL